MGEKEGSNNMNVNFNMNSSINKSVKDWLTTLLLCIFLGGIGAHRFYTNKAGTGILYLLTGGLVGIGWVIDIILIVSESYRDGYGNIVSR